VDAREVGIVVVFAGLAIVLLGVLISTGALSWFGRLPGDVRIEGRNVRVYAPIASMLLALARPKPDAGACQAVLLAIAPALPESGRDTDRLRRRTLGRFPPRTGRRDLCHSLGRHPS
jgi:hypothetical protein